MSMVQAYLVAYFIPLIMIFGWGLLNCSILRLPFISSVVAGLLESAIIVYICGFIDFRIGIALIILMALAGYGMSGRNIVLHQWIYEAMLVITLYTFLFALNAGKSLYKWDDYSHWGQMLKECLRLNTYYYVDESVLKYHKEYPPFGTIVEYIFCAFSGKYREAFAFNAKTFFGNILLLDAFQRVGNHKKIESKDFWVSLYSLPLIIMMPLIANWRDGLYYRTIYSEGFVITLMAYAVIGILFPLAQSRVNMLIMIMVLSALAITKQIGALFVIFIFILMIIKYKLLNEELHAKQSIPYVVSAIVWSIWKLKTTEVAARGQFSMSKFSIESLIKTVTGKGEKYQYQCTENYINALLGNSLTSFVPLTYLTIIALAMAAIIILYRLHLSKSRMCAFLIWCVVVLPIYMLVMQVLYWFGFSQSESIGIVCYDRYMNTLVVPLLMDVILLLKALFTNNHKSMAFYAIISCLIIFLLNGREIKSELTLGLYTISDARFFETDAEIISNNTDIESRIYLISPADNQSICNIIGYLANPRDISNNYYAPQISERLEVEEYMLQYDYVYIANVDEKFVNDYQDMFPDKLTNQQLYQVEKDGSLKRIY